MQKPITPNLTSYDFLKTAALVLMIIDHIGYYFYPDDMWWRAAGRLSAPIWLFLIGYAQSRDFSPRMWIGIGILFVTNYIVGQAILPLSILATMLIARALLDPLMAKINRSPATLFPFCAVFFFLTPVTFAFIEYGTEVMMFVMLGYLARNREKTSVTKSDYLFLAFLATASHIIYEVFLFFTFTAVQAVAVAAGLFAVTAILLRFRPAEYPALTVSMPRPLVWFFQLCGRHSLELYVAHLVVFRFASLVFGFSHSDFFVLHIFE